MEEALASKFPQLINRYLASREPVAIGDSSSHGQRANDCSDVSRQVIKRRLLQRDLVITGSCLDQTSDELPSDLYFYRSGSDDTRMSSRTVIAACRSSNILMILLDVIMGSGSIYPTLSRSPHRRHPARGEQMELVDGGFAHNSPVEAAVLWGATHIILIDVMERGGIKRGNFLQNAASSVQPLASASPVAGRPLARKA